MGDAELTRTNARVKLTGVEGLKAGDLNKAARDAMEVACKYWIDNNLDEHFKNTASAKYGYTPRMGERGSRRRVFKGSYTQRKLKKYGHSRPLEYSGDSRRLAKQSPITTRAKNSATEVAGRISLPAGFNRKHPQSDVRMQDEIRAITNGELRKLENVFAKEFEKHIGRSGVRVRARFVSV